MNKEEGESSGRSGGGGGGGGGSRPVWVCRGVGRSGGRGGGLATGRGREINRSVWQLHHTSALA